MINIIRKHNRKRYWLEMDKVNIDILQRNPSICGETTMYHVIMELQVKR